jgi:hypothetical protein
MRYKHLLDDEDYGAFLFCIEHSWNHIYIRARQPYWPYRFYWHLLTPHVMTFLLRFTKFDKYGNLSWVCTPAIDPDNYHKLREHAMKIKNDFPQSFSPIHYSQQYNTINVRTTAGKPSGKLADASTPEVGGVYRVCYDSLLKTKRTDNTEYVMLRLSSMVLEHAAPVDRPYSYEL